MDDFGFAISQTAYLEAGGLFLAAVGVFAFVVWRIT
jgi:hypothetical protein